MPLIRQLSKYLMILPRGILLAVEWEPLMYPRGFKALLRIGENLHLHITVPFSDIA